MTEYKLSRSITNEFIYVLFSIYVPTVKIEPMEWVTFHRTQGSHFSQISSDRSFVVKCLVS